VPAADGAEPSSRSGRRVGRLLAGAWDAFWQARLPRARRGAQKCACANAMLSRPRPRPLGHISCRARAAPHFRLCPEVHIATGPLAHVHCQYLLTMLSLGFAHSLHRPLAPQRPLPPRRSATSAWSTPPDVVSVLSRRVARHVRAGGMPEAVAATEGDHVRNPNRYA
jgi:hypothetical protein